MKYRTSFKDTFQALVLDISTSAKRFVPFSAHTGVPSLNTKSDGQKELSHVVASSVAMLTVSKRSYTIGAT